MPAVIPKLLLDGPRYGVDGGAVAGDDELFVPTNCWAGGVCFMEDGFAIMPLRRSKWATEPLFACNLSPAEHTVLVLSYRSVQLIAYTTRKRQATIC